MRGLRNLLCRQLGLREAKFQTRWHWHDQVVDMAAHGKRHLIVAHVRHSTTQRPPDLEELLDLRRLGRLVLQRRLRRNNQLAGNISGNHCHHLS